MSNPRAEYNKIRRNKKNRCSRCGGKNNSDKKTCFDCRNSQRKKPINF